MSLNFEAKVIEVKRQQIDVKLPKHYGKQHSLTLSHAGVLVFAQLPRENYARLPIADLAHEQIDEISPYPETVPQEPTNQTQFPIPYHVNVTINDRIKTYFTQILGTLHPLQIQTIQQTRKKKFQKRKHINATDDIVAGFFQQLFQKQTFNIKRVMYSNSTTRGLIQNFDDINTNPSTNKKVGTS